MQLFLEAKIDQFRLEDEKGVVERPVELLDSETKPNRISVARFLELTIANIDANSEEEEKEEDMDLKQMTGLRGLMANRNKGSTLKRSPRPQFLPVFHFLPHSSLLTSD